MAFSSTGPCENLGWQNQQAPGRARLDRRLPSGSPGYPRVSLFTSGTAFCHSALLLSPFFWLVSIFQRVLCLPSTSCLILLASGRLASHHPREPGQALEPACVVSHCSMSMAVLRPQPCPIHCFLLHPLFLGPLPAPLPEAQMRGPCNLSVYTTASTHQTHFPQHWLSLYTKTKTTQHKTPPIANL